MTPKGERPTRYDTITLTKCAEHQEYETIRNMSEATDSISILLEWAREYGTQQRVADVVAVGFIPFATDRCCPAAMYARYLSCAALRTMTQGE